MCVTTYWPTSACSTWLSAVDAADVRRRRRPVVVALPPCQVDGRDTSLDMAFPGNSSVEARGGVSWRTSTPYVDMFLPSIEEILFTLRRPTYERSCRGNPDGDILLPSHRTCCRSQRRVVGAGRQDRGLEAGLSGSICARPAAGVAAMGRARPAMSPRGPTGSCGRPVSRSMWLHGRLGRCDHRRLLAVAPPRTARRRRRHRRGGGRRLQRRGPGCAQRHPIVGGDNPSRGRRVAAAVGDRLGAGVVV